MPEEQWDKYCFEYYYNGNLYLFDVMATSEEDAVARIRCLSTNALLVGRQIAELNIPRGLSWLVRLIVWFRNWLLNR